MLWTPLLTWGLHYTLFHNDILDVLAPMNSNHVWFLSCLVACAVRTVAVLSCRSSSMMRNWQVMLTQQLGNCLKYVDLDLDVHIFVRGNKKIHFFFHKKSQVAISAKSKRFLHIYKYQSLADRSSVKVHSITFIIHGLWTGFETTCHSAHGGFETMHVWIFMTKSHHSLPHSFICRISKIRQNLLWKETYVAPGKAAAIVFEAWVQRLPSRP